MPMGNSTGDSPGERQQLGQRSYRPPTNQAPGPSFSSVILPPLQIPPHLQQEPYALKMPSLEPRPSSQSGFESTSPSQMSLAPQREAHSPYPYSSIPSSSSYRPASSSFQPSIPPVSLSHSSTQSYAVPSQQNVASPAVRLRFRQQPRGARACGGGARDRRTVDPPPILEIMDAEGAQMTPGQPSPHLSSVMSCTLWDECGQREETFGQGSNRDAKLMGSTVASCIRASDENDKRGYFFAFPDLSCRNYGRYRLRFALIGLSPFVEKVGTVRPILAYAMSDVFTVYNASEFPGMGASSALAMALLRQGYQVPMKKGKRSGIAAPEDETTAADFPSSSSGQGPSSSRPTLG